ncbi:PREDICTED: uncharacterized protein LOC104772310 [Camelina sativa]|uniref:Uncharacterized protein LOC104772310 n=1 Tax=Camelina sativa TaxID=90675 RepID=A0ABM0Y4B4_CAMSA|nr:PREDICTED: uncharacterized protein LOC104772310 [Camelina sativa]
MTTVMSCDVDVTAKIDSEKFNFSPMEKENLDEEDTESESETESEETESEGDGSVTVGKYRGLEDVEEPEPEWDVDSFDGREYESDPEIRDSFANENDYMEYREETIQALEDRVPKDPFNFIGAIQNLDGPAYENMTNREYLAGLVSMSVKKLNEVKGKTVEFVRIVRATTNAGGASWKLYITFMAREYPNGPLLEYQAKAMDFVGDSRPPFPILCRPSPKPLNHCLASEDKDTLE